MSTRLKMKCTSVKFTSGGAREFQLLPVHGPGNETWSKYTPGGILQFTVTNPDCESLTLDAEYFIDLNKVEEPPPA